MKYKTIIVSGVVIGLLSFLLYSYTNREILLSFNGNKNLEFSEYYSKNNIIYYRGQDAGHNSLHTFLTGSDIQSFRTIGSVGVDMYAKDKNNVWYNNILITGADSASFVMTGWFARDKNHIYYDQMPMTFLDTKTFEQVGQLFKDKNRVWVGFNNPYIPFSGDDSGKNQLKVDAKNFKQILCRNPLLNQFGRSIEIYLDDTWLFFDGGDSGIGILHGVGTGFDYDSITCNGNVIEDKYGIYATISGSDWYTISLVDRETILLQ